MAISDAASSSTYYNLPDVTAFSVLARRALTDALDRISGAKTLVLDNALAGPMGLVAEMPTLRDHGVDKLFWLESGPLSQAQKNIVYVCRPEISLMRVIADQIKSAPSSAPSHNYTILLSPRVTSVCANELETLGVLGSIDIQEFPLSLVPLERDVLSLELGPQAYKDIFLDSNYDPIYELARSLSTVQRAFGLVKRILGKGDAARRLVDIMFRLRKEIPSSAPSSGSAMSSYGQIDSMILLDRQVDMVTPFCTQLTYEGLIDEVIGIKNSFVEIDQTLTNPQPPTPSSSTAAQFSATHAPPRKKKHLLSTLGATSPAPPTASSGQPGSANANAAPAGDPLFSELRDKNFAVVGSVLNRTAKRINVDYEERHAAKTVGQIRDFVGRLSGLQAEHQALRLHTGLTEQIMGTTNTDEFNKGLEIQQNILAGVDLSTQENNIREFINQEMPVQTVLRLLCLYSLISGGLKLKVLEEFKREILQTYGYWYLPLLVSLSDLNLLFVRPASGGGSSKAPFSVARRPLRLIVDDVDESAPEDISYVYSGYAPLSARLVQYAIGLGSTSGGFVSGWTAGMAAVTSAGAAVGGIASGASGGNGQSQRDKERERTGAVVVGWKGVDEVVKTLPGMVFEETQKLDDGSTKGKYAFSQDHLPVSLVVFVGGCTYTELAALRFTSQRMSGRKLLVVTTGMINGNTLIDTLGPPK